MYGDIKLEGYDLIEFVKWESELNQIKIIQNNKKFIQYNINEDFHQYLFKIKI